MKHSLLVGLALRAAARVHFLHVPKSGGTFLHHVIRQAVDAQEGCDIHANTHVKLARDVSAEHAAFAVLREPCAHFLSAHEHMKRRPGLLERPLLEAAGDAAGFAAFLLANGTSRRPPTCAGHDAGMRRSRLSPPRTFVDGCVNFPWLRPQAQYFSPRVAVVCAPRGVLRRTRLCDGRARRRLPGGRPARVPRADPGRGRGPREPLRPRGRDHGPQGRRPHGDERGPLRPHARPRPVRARRGPLPRGRRALARDLRERVRLLRLC